MRECAAYALILPRRPQAQSPEGCRSERTGPRCASRVPGVLPEERQCDVHVRAQRLANGRPLFLGAQQRFPRVEMFGFVEVAARDVRKMLEARDREQIVPIGRLPDVDEARQRGAMIPEIAGADLETTHSAMVRVARNAQGALPPNLLQGVVWRLLSRDVALDVEGNDVRVLLAPKLVLRDLSARHDEEVVF